MIFDAHGNAVDAFEPTPEEYERRARMTRGIVTVTGPAPYVQSVSSSLLAAAVRQDGQAG